ncbi:F0F1 ATP synthase subunit gamma [Rhodanobacter aciditrophus]|uniref:F0F1 ATP synthase subunit gamma n=1 Tax=Rhodanobacter aciditrophus TaxID=1623218 RepID=UPI003CF0FA7C
MARWRELGRHIQALEDIGTILSAMRSLAFIEARRIAEGAARQQEAVSAIRVAIDNVVAHYPGARPGVMPSRDVVVLVGSERGLCGDFDERIASRLDATGRSGTVACIAVGSRLGQVLDERGVPHLSVAGAAVNEDIPGVMSDIVASIQASARRDHEATAGLVVVHHDAQGEVNRERILPVPAAPASRCWPHRPLLQLPARDLHRILIDHYVFASLNALLLASLLAENRRRLDQMSAALDRLHERVGVLDRGRRRARQEAITEEIEIILLGQGAAVAGNRAPVPNVVRRAP